MNINTKLIGRILLVLNIPSSTPRIVAGWLLAGLVAASVVGCSTFNRTIQVSTVPPGATVHIDGGERGRSPDTQKLEWKSDKTSPTTHRVKVELVDYESKEMDLSAADAKSQSENQPWVIPFNLEPLAQTRSVQFVSTPAGALVSLDGAQSNPAPCTIPVRFKRPDSSSLWGEIAVQASLKGYATEHIQLNVGRVTTNPVVEVEMTLLRDEVPLDITCNVEGAIVKVNGTVIGTAPMRHTFVFTRSDKVADWNTYLLVVEREGYRYRPETGVQPGDVQPFTSTLTYDLARKGGLAIKLEPIRFVLTPVVKMEPTSEGMKTILENLLSQVGDIEREPKVGGATKITDFDLDRAKYENRISVLTNSEQIIYSAPFWLPQAPDKTYFNLWHQRGNERTRVTDATQQDLEAYASADGQWFYFSSDRLLPGRYNIWRVPTIGRGGLTKITDSPSSVIDTEPTLSPDCKRLAFTTYLRGTTLPQIWVANADGTLPTQIRVGKSPAWSPDGAKLAYVAPDTAGHQKIWVMESDGATPTQMTTGEHTDQYPVWTPDGKRIIFASDQAVNEEGLRNWDIWIMKADGTGLTQLTVNGSQDTRPAVSPDGRFVYFYSNRGARKPGEPATQIYRITLPIE
jgi:hypothetical protein